MTPEPRIQAGQIYAACDPRDNGMRIKILGNPVTTPGLMGYGKCMIATLTDDGHELRPRRIDTRQLHATATTRDGQARRRGYALEDGA